MRYKLKKAINNNINNTDLLDIKHILLLLMDILILLLYIYKRP